MSTHPDEATDQKWWREATARFRALWRKQVGGTYNTLADGLCGVNLGVGSLGQSLRPNGRKPRGGADLLAAIAKLIAQKLSDRRPDLDSLEFEQAIKLHIIAGAPSPLDPRPFPVAVKSSRETALSAAIFTIDLWTPGQSSEVIVRSFAPGLGREGAALVKDLSIEAVDAIGRGDFARQLVIANEAIRIGDAAPETPLLGEGLYLKGEALRLMADFEPDRSEARRLRREAEEIYGRAETALRGDPRPIRGRARTMEVLGDPDGAIKLFGESLAAVEARRVSPAEPQFLSLAHERVRTLRHQINCLAVMHTSAPLATPEARRREEEIRRLLLASEAQHNEALRLFARHRDWWLIEWFMAQVLHAKGWASIHEDSWAVKRLQWSLKQRLEMMPDTGELNAVELGNLHWWLSVAREARAALEPEQNRALDALKASLDRGEARGTIKSLARRFLAAGEAPWAANGSS